MIVFGKFENEKHYVIRVSEELDEDTANIPSQFLNGNDSGELFEIVTLKPTTTTTTTATTTARPTTTRPRSRPTTTTARLTTTTARPITKLPRLFGRIEGIQRDVYPGFNPQSIRSYYDIYMHELRLNVSKLFHQPTE